MTPQSTLWGAVLFQAAVDATWAPKEGTGGRGENRMNQITADRWFRNGGRDFRDVCTRAGFDPDFIQEAYVSGRIDRARLKSGDLKA